MQTRTWCFALVGGLLAPLTAAAAPGFVSTDRYDDQSRAGAEMTYLVPGDFADEDDDLSLLRFDVHGHYVDPGSHVGGYLTLPLGYVSGNGDSVTALGNLEVGGLYVIQTGRPDLAVVARAGITLPTGPSIEEEGFDSVAGALASTLRPSDLFVALPKSSTLRLAISPTFRSGKLFARADAGVDINLYVADADNTIDPGLRFNLGVGADLGQVAITAELATLTATNNSGDEGEDSRTTAVGSLGVRGALGRVQPYAGLHVGLTDVASDIATVGFTAGVDVGF